MAHGHAHPHGGNEKSARYDRQLRLWGEDGQSLLENAKVLLLNANATGCETLKNLVLPGIGSFTVVDGKKVEAGDLGTNFFVTLKSVGESRARVVTELLGELNEYVKGHYVEEDPVELVEKKPDFVSQYTLVIASNLTESALRKVAATCWAKEIPLVVVRSLGLVGSIRIQVPEHRIVESKKDNIPDDLRLYEPWAELKAFADKVELQSLDSNAFSHVPFPVLLIKQLNAWRAAHGGKSPSGRKEQDEFKAALKAMQRSKQEENFEEALKHVFRATQPPQLPARVRELLADPKCGQVKADTPVFWVLMSALKLFVEKEGNGTVGPLAGGIPDMHTDTEQFIALQRLYAQKAEKDMQALSAHVHALVAHAGGHLTHGAPTEAQLKQFCKNIAALELVRFPSIDDELAGKVQHSAVQQALDDPATAQAAALYVGLRAVDSFVVSHRRYPGAFDDELAADLPLLRTAANAVAAQLHVDPARISGDLLHELARYGGGESHATGSLLGGVASQEVLKLMTGKWVPFNNTWVYNGIGSNATVLKL